MPIQITIRNVPTKVRDQLAARAASQGKSMQEYLRRELERLAEQPSIEEVLERMRQRKASTVRHIDPADILAARDADRR
jgi:antitoxin FitA